MSKLKEKCAAFEAIGKPPPMKPKPAYKLKDVSLKVESKPIPVDNTLEAFGNLPSPMEEKEEPCSPKVDNINEIRVIQITSDQEGSAYVDEIYGEETVEYYEPIESTAVDTVITTSDKERFSAELTYSLKQSVFDLPGLENFIYDPRISGSICDVELPMVVPDLIVSEVYNNSSDEHENQADSTASCKLMESMQSPYLVEAMYNTAGGRNSDCASDDVTNRSNLSNVSSLSADAIKNSGSTEEDKKKTQQTNIKSGFFSGLFKRKKCPEKSHIKGNTDINGSRESIDKCKSNHKHHQEDDSNSDDRRTKKPLNAIVNRDLLNSVGDGVKKKSSVLSELKNLFTNGKFKGFKKKSPKNDFDGHAEKREKVCDEDHYDDDGDVTTEQKETGPRSTALKPELKPDTAKKANKNLFYKETVADYACNNLQKSDSDSIYDDEYDDDVAPEAIGSVVVPDIQPLVKVEGSLTIEVRSSDMMDRRVVVSDEESIYDNEEEVEDIQPPKIIEKPAKPEKEKKLTKKKKTFLIPKVRGTQLYDEDGDVVEEYVSEDVVVPSSKNKVKPKDKVSIRNKKNEKTVKNKILKEKVAKEAETYDMDIEIVEEYISDVEDSIAVSSSGNTASSLDKIKVQDGLISKVITSRADVKETKIINLQKEMALKLQSTKSKAVLVSRTKIENERNQNDTQSTYLYDEDGEELEVYALEGEDGDIYDSDENETQVEPYITQEKLRNESKNNNSDNTITTNQNKDVKNIKSIAGVKNASEIYDAEDDDEMEIYEDEGDDHDSGPDDQKEKTRRKTSSENKSKMSITTKITDEIRRRKNNIITNIISSAPVKIVTPKKKTNQVKVRMCPVAVATEENLADIRKVEEDEDEALKNIIKKNIEQGKKTFKLSEPVHSMAIARAIKTSYLDNAMYIKFNIGEILDVLEYRNDLILVKNGVGKCGLTSVHNVQIIKNTP